MTTPTRRDLTAADHFKLAELFDKNDPRHHQAVANAELAFYFQPCHTGDLDWRHGYGEVFDQETDTAAEVEAYTTDDRLTIGIFCGFVTVGLFTWCALAYEVIQRWMHR